MNDELEKIISAHEKLIYKMASQFYGVDKEDLYQVGVIGLIKAYRNYKKEGNAKFSTYAHQYIFGEMYALATENRNVKVSRDVLKLYKKLEHTKYALAQRMNRIPTLEEIALYLELEPSVVEETMAQAQSILSLDEESNIEDKNLYDQIPDQKPVSIEDHIAVAECLDTLDDAERKIIDYRYFKDYTQQETANKLGMTQVMISRYEKKGLQKMRSFIAS